MNKSLSVLWLLLILTTFNSAFSKQVQVKGYTKKDGTVVQAHTREVKDKTPSDKQAVKGYTKKNGTVVKGYTRSKPKAK